MNSYFSSKQIKNKISILESTYQLKIGSKTVSYLVTTDFYSFEFVESSHPEIGIGLKCNDLVKILSESGGQDLRKTDVLYF